MRVLLTSFVLAALVENHKIQAFVPSSSSRYSNDLVYFDGSVVGHRRQLRQMRDDRADMSRDTQGNRMTPEEWNNQNSYRNEWQDYPPPPPPYGPGPPDYMWQQQQQQRDPRQHPSQDPRYDMMNQEQQQQQQQGSSSSRRPGPAEVREMMRGPPNMQQQQQFEYERERDYEQPRLNVPLETEAFERERKVLKRSSNPIDVRKRMRANVREDEQQPPMNDFNDYDESDMLEQIRREREALQNEISLLQQERENTVDALTQIDGGFDTLNYSNNNEQIRNQDNYSSSQSFSSPKTSSGITPMRVDQYDNVTPINVFDMNKKLGRESPTDVRERMRRRQQQYDFKEKDDDLFDTEEYVIGIPEISPTDDERISFDSLKEMERRINERSYDIEMREAQLREIELLQIQRREAELREAERREAAAYEPKSLSEPGPPITIFERNEKKKEGSTSDKLLANKMKDRYSIIDYPELNFPFEASSLSKFEFDKAISRRQNLGKGLSIDPIVDASFVEDPKIQNEELLEQRTKSNKEQSKVSRLRNRVKRNRQTLLDIKQQLKADQKLLRKEISQDDDQLDVSFFDDDDMFDDDDDTISSSFEIDTGIDESPPKVETRMKRNKISLYELEQQLKADEKLLRKENEQSKMMSESLASRRRRKRGRQNSSPTPEQLVNFQTTTNEDTDPANVFDTSKKEKRPTIVNFQSTNIENIPSLNVFDMNKKDKKLTGAEVRAKMRRDQPVDNSINSGITWQQQEILADVSVGTQQQDPSKRTSIPADTPALDKIDMNKQNKKLTAVEVRAKMRRERSTNNDSVEDTQGDGSTNFSNPVQDFLYSTEVDSAEQGEVVSLKATRVEKVRSVNVFDMNKKGKWPSAAEIRSKMRNDSDSVEETQGDSSTNFSNPVQDFLYSTEVDSAEQGEVVSLKATRVEKVRSVNVFDMNKKGKVPSAAEIRSKMRNDSDSVEETQGDGSTNFSNPVQDFLYSSEVDSAKQEEIVSLKAARVEKVRAVNVFDMNKKDKAPSAAEIRSKMRLGSPSASLNDQDDFNEVEEEVIENVSPMEQVVVSPVVIKQIEEVNSDKIEEQSKDAFAEVIGALKRQDGDVMKDDTKANVESEKTKDFEEISATESFEVARKQNIEIFKDESKASFERKKTVSTDVAEANRQKLMETVANTERKVSLVEEEAPQPANTEPKEDKVNVETKVSLVQKSESPKSVITEPNQLKASQITFTESESSESANMEPKQDSDFANKMFDASSFLAETEKIGEKMKEQVEMARGKVLTELEAKKEKVEKARGEVLKELEAKKKEIVKEVTDNPFVDMMKNIFKK